MGAVIETPAIYLDMSATGNLKEQYRVLGLRSFDTIPQLLKMVGLEQVRWLSKCPYWLSPCPPGC